MVQKNIPKDYGLKTMQFEKLPAYCKELFFSYINIFYEKFNSSLIDEFDFSCIDKCKSPIEEIFMFSFELVNLMHVHEHKNYYFISPQEKIDANGKTYYADFLFDSRFNDDGKNTFNDCDLKQVIIECDGHNFHEKTKAQVARHNKRDYDLEFAGYTVIHFSGSQIFNNPIECANQAYDFIDAKYKG